MMTPAHTFTIEVFDDPEAAPTNEVLMCYGCGGWRFMRRDSVGQWRSIMGRAKLSPKLWGFPPANPKVRP